MIERDPIPRKDNKKYRIAAGALAIGLATGGTVGAFVGRETARPSLSIESTDNLTDDNLDAAWLPETIQFYKDDIVSIANDYDVDPDFVAIIMMIESGGYSRAGSEDAAKGLMQITPIAEGDIRSQYLNKPLQEGEYDIYDPKTNIEFGVAFIAWLKSSILAEYPKITEGLLVEAIAAGYNGGLSGVAFPLLAGEGIVPDEAAFYSRIVRQMWTERNAGISPSAIRWQDLDRESGNLIAQATEEQPG